MSKADKSQDTQQKTLGCFSAARGNARSRCLYHGDEGPPKNTPARGAKRVINKNRYFDFKLLCVWRAPPSHNRYRISDQPILGNKEGATYYQVSTAAIVPARAPFTGARGWATRE